MKLIVLLLSCGICLGTASVRAENAAPSLPEAVKNVRTFEWKGKYPKGAELLKLERENVAQNAEVLAKLRQSLAEESLFQMAPPRVFYSLQNEKEAENAEESFDEFAKFRESARLLVRESNVRFADGDAVGAMQSRVDALRLAAAVTARGHYISSLVSNAIAFIAFRDVAPIIAQLDGPNALAAFEAIQKAQKLQPTRTQTLENERDSALLQAQLTLSHMQKMRSQPDYEKALKEMSRKEREAVENLTEEVVAQNTRRLFSVVIAQNEKPYSQWQKINIANLDNITAALAPLFNSKNSLFQYVRAQTQTALVQAALLQRAKTQCAISDEEFQKLLPLDPFGDGKLRVQGQTIYSVGPDGKDDGATAIAPKRFEFDAASGRFIQIKNPRVVVEIDSKGDILAPISLK